MESRARITLTNLSHSAVRRERCWSGFSVEYVCPEAGSSFSYDWTSNLHFCAYHDIVLEDGGVQAGDGAEDNRTDLRQTLTYVPCGARVSGWSKLSRRRNAYTAIYFDPATLRQELGARNWDQLGEDVYFRDDDIAGYLRQWTRLLQQAEGDALYEEALGLVTVLAIYRSSARISGEARPLGRTTVTLIVDFIEQNLSRNITLSELAAIANLSRFHFSRAFKATTGETPYQHVLRRRIERAKVLLAHSHLSLQDIAITVGFHDASHFQRAFRMRVGTSAQRFRTEDSLRGSRPDGS